LLINVTGAPDIVVVASRWPADFRSAAILARRKFADAFAPWPATDPRSAAVRWLAQQHLISQTDRRRDLLGECSRAGEQLRAGLSRLAETLDLIGDIRCEG